MCTILVGQWHIFLTTCRRMRKGLKGEGVRVVRCSMIQTMEDRQSWVLETDDAYRNQQQGYAHFNVFYYFSRECVQEYHTCVNIVPCVTWPSRMLELLFLVLQVEYYSYFVDFISDKSTEYCKVTFIIYYWCEMRHLVQYRSILFYRVAIILFDRKTIIFSVFFIVLRAKFLTYTCTFSKWELISNFYVIILPTETKNKKGL